MPFHAMTNHRITWIGVLALGVAAVARAQVSSPQPGTDPSRAPGSGGAPTVASGASQPRSSSEPGVHPGPDDVRTAALRAAFDRTVHDARVLQEALAECCERFPAPLPPSLSPPPPLIPRPPSSPPTLRPTSGPCASGQIAIDEAVDKGRVLAGEGKLQEALSALQVGTATARRALELCRRRARAHGGSEGSPRAQTFDDLNALLAKMLRELRDCCQEGRSGLTGAACETTIARTEQLRRRALADEAGRHTDSARAALREALNTAKWGLARCHGNPDPHGSGALSSP